MDVFLFINCAPAGSTRVAIHFPALDCNSEAYQHRLRFVYVILALWVLALPLFLLAFLTYLHRTGRLAKAATASRWGIFYRSFADRFYRYEVLLLVRRIAVVSISVLWMSNEDLRSDGLNTLFLALILIQVRYRPYSTAAANAWETVCLVGLALLSTLVSGHSVVHDGLYTLPVQVLSTLIVVIVGGLLCGAAAFGKLSRYRLCQPIVQHVQRLEMCTGCCGTSSSSLTSGPQELDDDDEAIQLIDDTELTARPELGLPAAGVSAESTQAYQELADRG